MPVIGLNGFNFIIPNVRTKNIFDNRNICCRTNDVFVNLFSGARVFNTD